MNVLLRVNSANVSAPDAASLGEKERETAPRGDFDVQNLVKEMGTLLASEGAMLAVGETAAGGALASLIVGGPTSAAWFCGGVVPYAGSTVPFVERIRDVADAHGLVSEEYAAALARLVRRAFACDWALAESGIAGPQTGRRSAKPVGMVCLAVAGPKLLQGIAQERGTGFRATKNVAADEEQVWATTRVLADKGRIANQHQFAVEALHQLRCVLSAQRTVG